MIAAWLVIGLVWVLLAVIVGLGIAQIIRGRDKQVPGGDA